VGSAGDELLRNLIASIAVGTVLAMLAAFYPAWRASKMPPAAALRSDF
jgi:ABC-type lipoprotein release transport system permease subunit